MSRVFLTGFMGCGKSVTGALLAARLSVEFIDLDDRIVEMAGCSIAEIFSERGEKAFRGLESAALQSLPDGIVCALGGGTFIDPENRAWSLKKAEVLYLHVGLPELVRRLRADRTARPLLEDQEGRPLDAIQMEDRIRCLFAERETFYRQAHQTINADGVSPEDVADKCLEAYRSRNVRR
jgi:shikimate kinase